MRCKMYVLSCAIGVLALAPAYGESAPANDRPLVSLPHIPSLDPAAMDTATNACDDFYRYACGGWMAQNPIPADQASWSVYGKLYRDNQQFLWGILTELAHQAPTRTPSQQKIGDYFAACMDEAAIDGRGSKPLAPTLESIAALKSLKELPALLATLHLDTGNGGFLFDLAANQDYANSSQVIAFIDAGGIGMPDRDYYTDADEHTRELRAEYQRHVARMFGLLGDSPGDAAQHASSVLRLETQLARASLTRVETRDPYKLFHVLDQHQLRELTPHFDWPAYFAAMGVPLPASVNVSQPNFLAALEQLLANTPLPEIRQYLRWHAAHSAAPYMSAAFDVENFAFFEHQLRGVPVPKPRWNRCVAHVDRQLGEALGQEFVARTFGPTLKSAAVGMTRQIEAAMRDDIRSLSWMSEATKVQALAKLDTVVNKIGYPDHWRDYGAVTVRPDDFFGNATRATRFEVRRVLSKIGKPLDRSEWGMTPQTVNAYYDPQMNDINFPAAVLQPPLYDSSLDDAPNFGDTGGTIGHELTHGFDDEGRQFDAHGNLKDWWTAADARQFEERTACIVDQYARYIVVDDVHLNSRLTLGEDVADLGGLILAHMAWRVQTAGKTLANRDGLSPEQRFFVGFAQWACENTRPENLRLEAKTDPHSPARYRVNGLVANMPEFRQAFSCPAQSPMVAVKPCRVW